MRHAAHDLLGRVLTGRMPGVSLNEAGRAQALRLAGHFAGRPIVAVVSSPLERAQETAAPIAAALGLEVVVNPGLHEIDFGDWTGASFGALQGMAGWDAWNRFRSMAPTPGGETMLQALARALDAIACICRAYPAGEVVLVSHQDVLKAVLAHCVGAPLDLLHRIELAPASRSVVRIDDADVRVDGMNLLV